MIVITLMDIVDMNDMIIGQADFDDVYASLNTENPMVFRTVSVFVIDHLGRLLVQKRSNSLRVAPGLWDSSAAGHIDIGDSYEKTALKELSEELGISVSKRELIFIGKLVPDQYSLWSFSVLYLLKHNGPFKTNEEVDEIRFVQINDLEKDIDKNPGKYSEHFKIMLNFYKKWLSKHDVKN